MDKKQTLSWIAEILRLIAAIVAGAAGSSIM